MLAPQQEKKWKCILQLVINYPLIRKKARIGKIATGIGVVALGTGFLSSLRMSAERPEWGVVVASYVALIVALGSLSLGRYYIGKWARRPRPDEVLAEVLKGFDSRYYLMSYLPSLPVEHLLVTPLGLIVVVVRSLAGDIRNRGNRWSRKFNFNQFFGGFSDGSLGNPSTDATRAVSAMRELLTTGLGAQAAEVPISAVAVFTDRKANLNIENPSVPVIGPDELQNYVRTLYPDRKLPRETIEQMLQLLAPQRAAPELRAVKEQVSRKRRSRKQAPPAADQSKLGRNRAERRMR